MLTLVVLICGRCTKRKITIVPLWFQVFIGNRRNCLRVSPGQVVRIAQLAAKNKENAPELLDLLCATITDEELDLPLRRNQEYVMKAVMKYYDEITHVLKKISDEK